MEIWGKKSLFLVDDDYDDRNHDYHYYHKRWLSPCGKSQSPVDDDNNDDDDHHRQRNFMNFFPTAVIAFCGTISADLLFRGSRGLYFNTTSNGMQNYFPSNFHCFTVLLLACILCHLWRTLGPSFVCLLLSKELKHNHDARIAFIRLQLDFLSAFKWKRRWPCSGFDMKLRNARYRFSYHLAYYKRLSLL